MLGRIVGVAFPGNNGRFTRCRGVLIEDDGWSATLAIPANTLGRTIASSFVVRTSEGELLRLIRVRRNNLVVCSGAWAQVPGVQSPLRSVMWACLDVAGKAIETAVETLYRPPEPQAEVVAQMQESADIERRIKKARTGE